MDKNAKDIYGILTGAGMSRAGALGMLGNMMAESSLIPNIVQRGMTKLTDAQYTAAADNGLIDFVHDSIGYGLCQWTFYARKQALLDYAKANGVSVGNLSMQCQFCLKELREDYPVLFKFLCESDDINACTDRICMEYERPAVNNLITRRNYAHQFEKEIPENAYQPPIKDPVSATFPPDPTVLAFQLWMNYNGYTCEINGYKSGDFFPTLERFVEDMKSC